MKTIEQIALEVADEMGIVWREGCDFESGIVEVEAIDFAEKFLAAWLEQQSQEPVAYMAPSGTCVTAEDVSYTPNWTDYYTIPLYAAPPAKVEQQSQEPVAWYSHSGTLAYDKKSFPPSTQHLAKPLFLAPPPAIPDWIGVDDRLPEEHQEVMCAFGNGNMLILEFDRSLAPYRFIDRDSGKWWSLKIKHWMPLPNPPAQGEQE